MLNRSLLGKGLSLRLRRSGPVLFSAFFALLLSAGVLSGRSNVDQNQVAGAVVRLLEQGHYTRQKLNNELARQVLETYMRNLDYNKQYFTQEDINYFENKYGDELDEDLLRGDITPAKEIFMRFRQRVGDRVAKNKALLENNKFTFDSDRTVLMNRQHANWPANEQEADTLWRNRVEADLLQETLSQEKLKKKDSPAVVVAKRYDQFLKDISEYGDEDVLKGILSALALTYDPHSDYLSPSEMENFAISMRLSLVGVGAVLKSEDGYAKVVEVVKGGPADRDGRLHVNDRIVGVAQGDGEFEDVVDMKLDKVVEKIRGKKGSIVRLSVIPANAADPSERKIIDIARDEVKLKEQEARADLIEIPTEDGKGTERIGWITLPSFYANIDRRGAPKSTTEDVSRLIERLQKEGIKGLVIDLRSDGGGSLDEAIRLTGLFIPEGPVVQSKDPTGRVTVSRDDDGGALYNGPLIVLMNRLSASASEIFAAALQDYGRAVIVGDERSFGKGTVQQVVDVGRFMPFFSLAASDAGSLKLTVQKFYRVLGGSTQLHGVKSDIVLPSLTDSPEIGESALQHPLAYDEVAPQKIKVMTQYRSRLDELKQRSMERVKQDPEFQYIMQDVQRMKQRLEDNKVSLNLKQREAELKVDKERQEQREVERKGRGPEMEASAFRLTLDDVDNPKLQAVPFDKIDLRESSMDKQVDTNTIETDESQIKEAPRADPTRVETLRIMRDLIAVESGEGLTAEVPKK